MLKIQIAKRADGAGVLSCRRADGTVTWQKQTTRTAVHFALHDLTHYAVERTLGYQRGFFGLIDEGWDIDDTTGKGARGALPSEALEVESVVGMFDRERASQSNWTAEEFNQYLPRTLTEKEMEAVRKCRADLFQSWSEVMVGSTLELNWTKDNLS